MNRNPIQRALNNYAEGRYTPTEDQESHALRVFDTAIDAYRDRKLMRHKREEWVRGQRLYASDPYWCPRKLALILRGEKEPPNSFGEQAQNNTDAGDLLEARYVSRMILSGLPVISPNPEQERLVGKIAGFQVSGRLDVKMDGAPWGEQYAGKEIPVDVKSTDHYTLQKIQKNGILHEECSGEMWGYNTQLMGMYAHELDAPFGVFFFVNRSIGHTFEIQVWPDPKWRAQMGTAVAQATHANENGGLPEMPEWATTKWMPRNKCHEIEHKRCGYCGLKRFCFPDFKPETVSGQKRWRKYASE